jgi:hypothetical protein
MKMRKITAILVLLAVIGMLSFADASVKDIIITPTNPSSLKVQIWMDRSTGATYYPGDSARIYFKTSENAYVVIYDFATDGSVRVLFPNFFQRDNYVKGGVVYTIPDPRYNYSLMVNGPNGREFLEIIASMNPNVLPNVPLEDASPFTEYPSGAQYMQKLKMELVRKPIAVTTTYFYVGYVPQLGTVNFTSSPNGASLYVDGDYKGKTPQTLQLPAGNHTATFLYNGKSVSKTFTVQGGQYMTINGVIPMLPSQPLNVRVSVNTYPTGALVFVNGKMLGVSPCTLELSPGTYEFTIVKPNYRTIVRSVVLKNNMSLNFQLNKIGNYTSY